MCYCDIIIVNVIDPLCVDSYCGQLVLLLLLCIVDSWTQTDCVLLANIIICYYYYYYYYWTVIIIGH